MTSGSKMTGASSSQSSSAVCPSSSGSLSAGTFRTASRKKASLNSGLNSRSRNGGVCRWRTIRVSGRRRVPEVLAVPVAGIVGRGSPTFSVFAGCIFRSDPKGCHGLPVPLRTDNISVFSGDGQPVEPVHPVTEHLQICKLLVIIGKSFCLHVRYE